MARCPYCRHYFRTLDDEEGMHDCPYCGYLGYPPLEDLEDEETEDDEENT